MTALDAAAAPGTTGAADSRQFVSFLLDDDAFGVPLADVQEIIRMPDLVKVPLAPRALLGLANLRGTVLPVASLRRAFDLDEREPDESMRVVVVNRGVTMGVVVDRMSSVLSAEADDVESVEHLASVTRSDLIENVVKTTSGRIMVFDPIRVLEGLFDRGAEEDEAGSSVARRDARGADPEEVDVGGAEERRLVSFEVGDQEYAFDIGRVKEIVTLPEAVASVPRAPSAMVGIMVLRERILPLVSLRALLGLPFDPRAEHQRRVVVTTGFAREGLAVGVVVDSVREVLRLTETAVDPVPPLLAEGRDDLEAICRLDGGERVVTVLAVDRLIDVAALADEAERAIEDSRGDEMATQAHEQSANTHGDPEEQVVVFRLEGEAYGIPVDAVQEIVRVPEQMTRVPKAPAFVEGIINLRGEVLPVIDQRRRFGIATAERNDRQRIVVLKLRGQIMGFVVDSVAEVRKIPASVIGPAPALSEAQRRIIRRVANLGGDRGIVMLLEPDQLISDAEGEAVSELGGAAT